jgi:hypothetical protein
MGGDMKKQPSLFFPMVMIAAGVLWLLVSGKVIPAASLWALVHMWPYLLIALGLGMILRGWWPAAGMIVSALVVIGAVLAVVYAPQLGWAREPAWDVEYSFTGGVKGSGKIEAETRKVTDFTAVSINYPAVVVIRQGGSESVRVEADDNLLPQLDTQVRGDTLLIQNGERDRSKRVHPSQTVKITITVKDLRELDFSTAGTVRGEGLEAERLEVALSGAGEVTLTDLNVQQLDCRLSGAGNIHADGTAEKVNVQIDGFGSFYGDELESVEAEVGINGAGSANLRVKENLVAEINGAGSVGYYGSPDVDQHINGAGAVKQLGK